MVKVNLMLSDDNTIVGYGYVGTYNVNPPDIPYVELTQEQVDSIRLESTQYINGELVYNDYQEPELLPLNVQLMRAVQPLAQALPEPQMATVPDLFNDWAPDTSYSADEIVRYPHDLINLYRVVSPHTSQADWIPPNVPALYTPIKYASDGVLVWMQPTGAHDSYGKGDIAWHNRQKWESLQDGNVWEPGADTNLWREMA